MELPVAPAAYPGKQWLHRLRPELIPIQAHVRNRARWRWRRPCFDSGRWRQSKDRERRSDPIVLELGPDFRVDSSNCHRDRESLDGGEQTLDEGGAARAVLGAVDAVK